MIEEPSFSMVASRNLPFPSTYPLRSVTLKLIRFSKSPSPTKSGTVYANWTGITSLIGWSLGFSFSFLVELVETTRNASCWKLSRPESGLIEISIRFWDRDGRTKSFSLNETQGAIWEETELSKETLPSWFFAAPIERFIRWSLPTMSRISTVRRKISFFEDINHNLLLSVYSWEFGGLESGITDTLTPRAAVAAGIPIDRSPSSVGTSSAYTARFCFA